MNRKLGLKISLFANAGLIALTALLAVRPNFMAYAMAMDARGGFSALKHGERTSFRRDGLRHFCTDQDGEHLDTLAASNCKFKILRGINRCARHWVIQHKLD